MSPGTSIGTLKPRHSVLSLPVCTPVLAPPSQGLRGRENLVPAVPRHGSLVSSHGSWGSEELAPPFNVFPPLPQKLLALGGEGINFVLWEL